MITVLPEKDGEKIKELFLSSNKEFTENSYAVTAKSGEEVLGYCIFTIADKTVTIHNLEPKEDIMLADGILRSALHVAAERFIFSAKYDNEEIENLLDNLLFIKDKAAKVIDMDKLFGGCGCGKKK